MAAKNDPLKNPPAPPPIAESTRPGTLPGAPGIKINYVGDASTPTTQTIKPVVGKPGFSPKGGK